MNGKRLNKKCLVILLSAILVISTMVAIASASDWPQFQKDKVNIGWTGDNAPITAPNNWSQLTAHAGWSGIDSVPVVVGDYVYVLAADGSNAMLFKYTKSGVAAGGSWPVTVGSGGYQNSCPAYGGGNIFVLNSADHTLYAVNATTGSMTSAATGWDTNPVVAGSCQLSSPITYHKDDNENFGRLFFGDCEDAGANDYYCYNASDGTQLWDYIGAGKNYWAGCAVIGDYIVFGNDSGCLTSLNWSNGAYVDSLCLGGNHAIRSSITWNATSATYGHIFFTNKSGTNAYVSKIGFDISTGDIVASDWTSSSNIRYSTSTPAVYKGRVYVGGGNFTEATNNRLLCLDESDLTQIWQGNLNGAAQASPAISTWYDNGVNNVVYIYITTNTANGRLYCFKDYAGNTAAREQWYYQPPADKIQFTLQGAAVSDGYAFFGNDAGYLFGLSSGLREENVTLIENSTVTVTAHNSGNSYEVNQTTALGALDAAAAKGGFNYTVSDEWYSGFGLFVDSIADKEAAGLEGWSYWVNYPTDPKPAISVDKYAVEDGDVVTYYYGSWTTTPDNSSMVIRINVKTEGEAADWHQFQKDKIASGWTTDSAPANDPALAWWKQTSGTGMGGIDVTPIVGDGGVYVLDYQGILWSFDAKTGEENWHTDLTEGSGTFELSTPAYNEGIVYAVVSSGSGGQGAGRVCAVYANNGTIRECEYYGLQYFQLNTPVRYADGKIYIGNWKGGASHTDDNGTYYCIDADNVSNLIWSKTAPYVTGYYWAGAAIVGDYVIYGDDRANVTCLNKDTGAFVDHINVSEACGITPVEEIRSSIVWNESTGRIYFTGKKSSPLSGHAYAVSFNPVTGDLGGTCEWSTDIGYSTSTPAVYNGRVYVCIGGMYGESGVRCLNDVDGSIRYSIDKGASQASPAVSVVDGHVYIYFTTNVNNGSAYCIEDTGTELVEKWIWNPPEPDNQYILQGMAISDGMVYFGTDYGRVYALRARTLWEGNVTLIENSTVTVTAHNSGKSYEVNQTTALGALDAASEAGGFNYTISDEWYPAMGLYVDSIADKECEGMEGWLYWVNYPTDPRPVISVDKYAVKNGDVVSYYYGEWTTTPDNSSMVIRINVKTEGGGWPQFHKDVRHSGFSTSTAPNTNKTLWISEDINAVPGSSTVVAEGKVFAYGGPTGWSGGKGQLYCRDEFTGEIIWNVSIPAPEWSSWSSPAYHDGKVFTSTGNETRCYNATSGDYIWTFVNPSGKASCNGGPAIADGKVFCSDWDGRHYYGLDEETGELLWTFTENNTGSWGTAYAQGTPAYAEGKVYLTTWVYPGGHIYCVDADTGANVWNQTTPRDTGGSPTVSNDMVYVTTYDFNGMGDIYALDKNNGSILWQQTIQRSDSTPAVAYGNVYVCGGCKGYSDVLTYCFNATTGELKWNTTTSEGIGAWTDSVAVADGKVFVGTEGGDFFDYAGTYALDAFTGDVIWSYPEGGSSPAVADGVVFTIGGGKIYAFAQAALDWEQFHYDIANTGYTPSKAPDTNQRKWVTGDIGAVEGSQAMIAEDNVFVYCDDTVKALNKGTGATIWNTSIPGDTSGFGSWASPAYSDDVLFVSSGYNLSRINVSDGSVLQMISFPDGGHSCNGGPTVADGMVFAGSGYGNPTAHYYAFNASDITDVIWNFDVGSDVAGSVPAVAGNRVIFGNGSSLTCVNKIAGSLGWTTDLNSGTIFGSAAIDAANDRVYVATGSGGLALLHALNFTDGSLIWTSSPTKFTDGTPAFMDIDHVYISGNAWGVTGRTYCFNSTGVEQWNVSCGSWVMSPAVADGKLFTGDCDGPWGTFKGISAYNATDGTPVWSYQYAGSSPSVTEDANGNGMVVSIGKGGKVYAFAHQAGLPISGLTGEVNCSIEPDVTVILYNKTTGNKVAETTSDTNGNYTLSAPCSGEYNVNASKAGFKNVSQEISITGVAYTLNFRGEHGLTPEDPEMPYVLECVNHWQYPPSVECGLTMAKVLEVVNAWLY